MGHDDPLSTPAAPSRRKRTRSATSEVFLSDADFEDAPPPSSANAAANAKGKRRTQQRVQSLSNGLDSNSRQVKVNVERLRTSKSVDGLNNEGDDEDEDEDEELDLRMTATMTMIVKRAMKMPTTMTITTGKKRRMDQTK